ncbi:hypothetical protein NDU88_005072 [Pleurodeles waltl]|uniref:Uncharacterized protein n=1 Tax=Pleurodeles waltl TaxID=8319 RepID=A0AAV7W9E4_PLEWA|nr:hypothetical protein NDU88_005072 [Pleurodeles waltl]
MQGHFRCEQVLEAAVFAVDKSTSIMKGAPHTLSAEHSVFAVIQKSKSTLTKQRVSGYKLILSRPSPKVVNPATFLALEVQEWEETLDCVTYTLKGISQRMEELILVSGALFIDDSSMNEMGEDTQGQQ